METRCSRGMRSVAIGGTMSAGNFTATALALVTDEIRRPADIALDVLDPATLDLPSLGVDGHSSGPEQL